MVDVVADTELEGLSRSEPLYFRRLAQSCALFSKGDSAIGVRLLRCQLLILARSPHGQTSGRFAVIPRDLGLSRKSEKFQQEMHGQEKGTLGWGGRNLK